VFPGAEHTRFAHSIVVMHVARIFLDRITRVLGRKIDETQQTAVLAASLLHDIGHAPFSHAMEKIIGERHEKRTREIILSDTTEVNQRLREFDRDLPARLDEFYSEDVDEGSGEQDNIPAFLTQIVSSQLDADRFDYLLRDSLATGTDYGQFDLRWLMQNLFLDEERSRFFLGHKAILAAEHYVYARYHMYRMVYFHKTTRAAEVMLRLLFERFKAEMQIAESDSARHKVAPGAPDAVLRAFSEGMSLETFLELDDYSIVEFWRGCQRSDDRWLAELGGRLLHRRLYKAIDVTEFTSPSVADFVGKVKEAIRERGIDPDIGLAYDTPTDTPYKPYDPDEEKPATQIYAESVAGPPRELGWHSDLVEGLKKEYMLCRYYFPERIRGEVQAIAKSTLVRRE
jgi:HD superfamily phosphohydrolase